MDERRFEASRFLKGRGAVSCAIMERITDNQFHNLGVPEVGPMKEDLVGSMSAVRKKTRVRSRHRPFGRYYENCSVHARLRLHWRKSSEFLDQKAGTTLI